MLGELKLLARHSHGRHKIARRTVPGLLRDFRTHWEVSISRGALSRNVLTNLEQEVVKAMAWYVPTIEPFAKGSGLKLPGR